MLLAGFRYSFYCTLQVFFGQIHIHTESYAAKHPTLQTDAQHQLTDKSAEFRVEVKIKAMSNKAFDQKLLTTQ